MWHTCTSISVFGNDTTKTTQTPVVVSRGATAQYIQLVKRSVPTMTNTPSPSINNANNGSKRKRPIIVVATVVLLTAIILIGVFGVKNNGERGGSSSNNSINVSSPTEGASSTPNDDSSSLNNMPLSTPLPTNRPTRPPPTMQPTPIPTLRPSPTPTFYPTTQEPTRSPIPYTSSQSLLLCDPNIQCMTDRWGHHDMLYVGQSMCNDVWRFGVVQLEPSSGSNNDNNEASLVWQDCDVPTTYYLQTVSTSTNASNSVAFQLTQHGVFQLWEVTRNGLIEEAGNATSSSLLWELESVYTPEIQPSKRCLSNDPIMDCPYLHLRARGGNIVMNYIGAGTGWNARAIKRAFPNLFPESYNP